MKPTTFAKIKNVAVLRLFIISYIISEIPSYLQIFPERRRKGPAQRSAKVSGLELQVTLTAAIPGGYSRHFRMGECRKGYLTLTLSKENKIEN